LKYDIKVSKEIELSPPYNVFAGDYFTFDTFEVHDPRYMLNCLKIRCNFDMDSILLLKQKIEDNVIYTLVAISNGNKLCSTVEEIQNIIYKCSKNDNFKDGIKRKYIKISLIKENPINFLETRKEMLNKVRNGKIPKGILKKWPFYVIEI
jgi:hypothetical protein